MKKVLITCLRNESDTIESSQVINSFIKYNPKSHITVLCYKDYYQSAKLLSGVHEVTTIDRDRVNHLLSGELYSDAFAINSFTQSLNSILSTKWDTIVNLSNDEVSAYLAPLISPDEIIGTYISDVGSALTSNKWAMYQNFVSDVDTYNTIHPIDIRHHMMGIPFANDSQSTLVKMENDFATLAAQKFSKIRSQKSGRANIIGICLSHPETTKTYMSIDSLIEIVDTLRLSDHFIPLLITNGSDTEKDIVSQLNHRDNSIISVNADTAALPSVIANLDALISQPNKALSLAQCLDVLTIEVKPPAVKGNVYQEGSFSIHLQEEDSSFHDDALFLLNSVSDSYLPMESQNSNNKVYAIVKDEYSTFRTLVRGEQNTTFEVLYNIQRCFNFTMMGYPINEDLISDIRAHIPNEKLNSIIDFSRDEIIVTSKLLLKTIRSLKSIEQASNGLEFFVQNLDELISRSHNQLIESSAIALFEGRIENIKGLDRDKNLKEIEKFLFQLKSDLHNLSLIFEKLTRKEEVKNINL